MIRLYQPLRVRPIAHRRRPLLRTAPPVDLVWSHEGEHWRATVGPEVRFERRAGRRWRLAEPSGAALTAGRVALSPMAWRRYLEFLPSAERGVLQRFRLGRLHALHVLAACPTLTANLLETPALIPFLASHAALRGTTESRWTEIAALHERSGIFGVLEWLGLPATRDTVLALQNLSDPDLPHRLLAPLRARLWDPAVRTFLCQGPGLSERELAHVCQPLAA